MMDKGMGALAALFGRGTDKIGGAFDALMGGNQIGGGAPMGNPTDPASWQTKVKRGFWHPDNRGRMALGAGLMSMGDMYSNQGQQNMGAFQGLLPMMMRQRLAGSNTEDMRGNPNRPGRVR